MNQFSGLLSLHFVSFFQKQILARLCCTVSFLFQSLLVPGCCFSTFHTIWERYGEVFGLPVCLLLRSPWISTLPACAQPSSAFLQAKWELGSFGKEKD